MFSSCANPGCRAEFNFRQGAIFRFRKQPIKDGQTAKTDWFRHFWLCAECAELYRLEYLSGQGVLLSLKANCPKWEARDSATVKRLSRCDV